MTVLLSSRLQGSRKSASSPTIHVIDDTEEDSENEVVEEDPWDENDDDAGEGGDASEDDSSHDSFLASDDDEAVELPGQWAFYSPSRLVPTDLSTFSPLSS